MITFYVAVVLLTARVRGVLHEVLDAVPVDDEALHGSVQADAHARRPTHGVREPEGGERACTQFVLQGQDYKSMSVSTLGFP